MLMCISWNVISNHNTVNTGTYSQAYSHQQTTQLRTVVYTRNSWHWVVMATTPCLHWSRRSTAAWWCSCGRVFS